MATAACAARPPTQRRRSSSQPSPSGATACSTPTTRSRTRSGSARASPSTTACGARSAASGVGSGPMVGRPGLRSGTLGGSPRRTRVTRRPLGSSSSTSAQRVRPASTSWSSTASSAGIRSVVSAMVLESLSSERSSVVRAATCASSRSWAPAMLAAMASNERDSSPSSEGSVEPTRADRSPAARARLAWVRRAIGSTSSAREKAVAASSVTATTTARLMRVLRRMAATVARSAPASASPTVAGSPAAPSWPVGSKPAASMPTAASARHSSTAVATASTNTAPSSSRVRRAERRWCQRISPSAGGAPAPSWLPHHPPLPDGVERRLGAALEAELREQVRHVRLHGGLADAQLLRDGLVAGAGGDQLQHLELALGERLAHLGGAHLAHQALLGAGVEAHLPAGGGAHGLEQLVGAGLLEQVAAGAGLHDVDDEAVLQHARERHHLHLGVVAADGAGGVDAVHDGHQQVHDHHVGGELRDPLHGLLAVGGLAHHLEVGLEVER